jgi:hypothetical protein
VWSDLVDELSYADDGTLSIVNWQAAGNHQLFILKTTVFTKSPINIAICFLLSL